MLDSSLSEAAPRDFVRDSTLFMLRSHILTPIRSVDLPCILYDVTMSLKVYEMLDKDCFAVVVTA